MHSPNLTPLWTPFTRPFSTSKRTASLKVPQEGRVTTVTSAPDSLWAA